MVIDLNGLIHRVTWTPSTLCEQALSIKKVLFLIGGQEPNDLVYAYDKQLADEGYVTAIVRDPTRIVPLLMLDTIVVHIPYAAKAKNDVYEAATKPCITLIAAL